MTKHTIKILAIGSLLAVALPAFAGGKTFDVQPSGPNQAYAQGFKMKVNQKSVSVSDLGHGVNMNFHATLDQKYKPRIAAYKGFEQFYPKTSTSIGWTSILLKTKALKAGDTVYLRNNAGERGYTEAYTIAK